MKPDDDQLRPDQIDAQIEWLTQSWSEEPQPDNQNAQLAQQLQRHYTKIKQEQILQRAWQSIEKKYEEGSPSSSLEKSAHFEQQERIGQYHMQQYITDNQVVKKPFPRWGILLAVAVIALLIGTTAVIMNQVNLHKNTPQTGGNGGNHPYCTPTAAPEPITPLPTVAPIQPTAAPAQQPTVVPIQPTAAPVQPTVAPIPPCTPAPIPTTPPTSPPAPIPTTPPTSPPAPIPTAPPTSPIPTLSPTAIPAK